MGELYPQFGASINKTGRHMLYVCSWPAYIVGHADFQLIAKYCNQVCGAHFSAGVQVLYIVAKLARCRRNCRAVAVACMVSWLFAIGRLA